MKRWLLHSGLLLLVGCVSPNKQTLSNLDYDAVQIKQDKVKSISNREVMQKYREFLDDATVSHPLYSNAVNRLADLEMVEGDSQVFKEQEQQFAEAFNAMNNGNKGQDAAMGNYANAIALYENLLQSNPKDRRGDWVLYQLSRAYEQSADLEGAVGALQRLVNRYPRSQYVIESYFRLGELHYALLEFSKAEMAYFYVLKQGRISNYYDKSLYKYGWSLFKQERYEESLDYFFTALKALPINYDTLDRFDTTGLSQLEKEMLNDILRAINLCFSYAGGPKIAARYFDRNRVERYEFAVFTRLAFYYVETSRIKDAADTYKIFIERNPMHPMAPEAALQRIGAYQKGGFFNNALAARKEFVQQFGVKTVFWRTLDSISQQQAGRNLKKILFELSEYYHAQAQKSRSAPMFDEALRWYRELVESFPGEDTVNEQFLLAELLFEKQDYTAALFYYERVAYELPKTEHSRDAGYAALLTYERMIASSPRELLFSWREKWVASALKFIAWNNDDKRVTSIQARIAEHLFDMKKYDDAMIHAKALVEQNKQLSRALQTSAYLIIAHVEYERGEYRSAISAYGKVKEDPGLKRNVRDNVSERLAVANYRLAEQARNQGQLALAAKSFLQSASISMDADTKAKAEYDAATAYIELNDWTQAINLLTAFREHYPDNSLQSGVAEKLLTAYEKTEQFDLAAEELLRLSESSSDSDQKRNMLWLAAEYFDRTNKRSKAIDAYRNYVRQYPQPLAVAMEGRYRLSQLYTAQGQRRESDYWQAEIIKAHKQAGSSNTPRTDYLAANASFLKAESVYENYRNQKLNLPLKNSLKAKKQWMERAIAAYDEVGAYRVADFTTASTFRVAEVYREFAVSLMTSQRPRGLAADELEEYSVQLEEQAYPFEEKAISLYETNMQRIKNGVFDEWIRKTIIELGTLQPARYGKREEYEMAFDKVF